MATPYEFWPESEEQHEWMTSTITDASAVFQILPRDAVIKAFQLLAAETTLHKEWFAKVQERIKGA